MQLGVPHLTTVGPTVSGTSRRQFLLLGGCGDYCETVGHGKKGMSGKSAQAPGFDEPHAPRLVTCRGEADAQRQSDRWRAVSVECYAMC